MQASLVPAPPVHLDEDFPCMSLKICKLGLLHAAELSSQVSTLLSKFGLRYVSLSHGIREKKLSLSAPANVSVVVDFKFSPAREA